MQLDAIMIDSRKRVMIAIITSLLLIGLNIIAVLTGKAQQLYSSIDTSVIATYRD